MLAAMRVSAATVLSSALVVACGSSGPPPSPFDQLYENGTGGDPNASTLAGTGGFTSTPGANMGGVFIVDPNSPLGGAAPVGTVPVQAGAPPIVPPVTDPNMPPAMPTGTAPPAYVPPPSALSDIQFQMASKIAPGGETLMCSFMQFPADRGVIAVPSAESLFTPGSHHLLAYRSDLTDIPTNQLGVWPCSDGSWMVHQRGSYYEAQEPMSRRDLPPGVAHHFQPGEVVILQTHYVNTSTDELDAHAQLTLHTVEIATVPMEAGSIIFSDVNISVPPGGKSRSQMTCTLPADFNPALLWSHMHKRASNFIATTDDPAAMAAIGVLYAENDWEEPHPRAYPFDPPVTLHAGTHITFSCDFTNPGTTTLTFGQSAETNEMCLLHGMYWPRMSASAEQCYGGKTTRTALQ
jgi:Copper type II ascorbate-dependent monooxygenase, C-terminal domain